MPRPGRTGKVSGGAGIEALSCRGASEAASGTPIREGSLTARGHSGPGRSTLAAWGAQEIPALAESAWAGRPVCWRPGRHLRQHGAAAGTGAVSRTPGRKGPPPVPLPQRRAPTRDPACRPSRSEGGDRHHSGSRAVSCQVQVSRPCQRELWQGLECPPCTGK